MNKNYPVIPWIGGKRRLAKTILPLFPVHTCYVEPFCGAAALYFMKDQAEVEVLNDINGELVNLYRVIKHHLDEFVRQFRWSLTSRQIYKWLQATPRGNIDGHPTRRPFLLFAKTGIRRQGCRSKLRNSHHQSAALKLA